MFRLSLFFTLAMLVSFGQLSANCLVPTPASPIVHSFETGLEGFTNGSDVFPGYTNFNAVQATAPIAGDRVLVMVLVIV